MVSLKDKGNFQSTPRDPIIEAAARALYAHDTRDDDAWKGRTWGFETKSEDYFNLATAVLAAVTPLIEAAYARRLDAAEEIARKGNEYTKGWKLLEDDGSVTTLGTSGHDSFAPEGRHWRHVTSGMFVTEIGRGRMQTAEPIGDMTPIVIYHHAGEHGGGTFWVRPVAEFEDGRFVAFIAEP